MRLNEAKVNKSATLMSNFWKKNWLFYINMIGMQLSWYWCMLQILLKAYSLKKNWENELG